MAIEKDEDVGALTLRCDDCDDLLDGDFNLDDFQGMIEFAKNHGWKIRPDGEGGWVHRCGCSVETPLERARRLLDD